MTAADRLDEIEARAEKATEGPWEADHSEEDNSAVKPVGADWIDGVAFAGLEADAEFIAHARDDVPRLVAALRAVLDVCDGLEEAHRANPDQAYEYGLEEAAHQVRNAIEAAFGEVAS